MKKRNFTRRQLLATASAGTLGIMAAGPVKAFFSSGLDQDKPAILGGKPVRIAPWPDWPVWDPSAEKEIPEMLRSGRWWRGDGEYVAEFEEKYAGFISAGRCLATAACSTLNHYMP